MNLFIHLNICMPTYYMRDTVVVGKWMQVKIRQNSIFYGAHIPVRNPTARTQSEIVIVL